MTEQQKVGSITDSQLHVATVVPQPSLLDTIIAQTRVARSDTERLRTRDLIGELVTQVLEGELTPSNDLIAAMDARIAEIDALLSAQTNEIMHAPEFQKLEGSWRGLNYQVDRTETNNTLKIQLLNVSKKDLVRDFQSASEFDQNGLFKKVYEEEYGTFGGAPFGMLIGDYEFDRSPEDIYLLQQIAHVAAAAHAPFIAAASPELFGWDSFTEMSGPRHLAKIFESVEYTKYRAFRNTEDARYVALTAPRVLGRLPYGPDTVPVTAFNFPEDVDGRDHSKYLWINSAFALGTCITNAFSRNGWCVAIRGVEGGGLVEGLPAHTFTTDDGEVALKCPTEIAITDRREKELSDLGFIPLVHCKDTDQAAFFATQTTQKPKQYNTDIANANARLAAQLQYLFATSRIAHYMKAIMRDKIGSFASRADVERYLNKWLGTYTLADDTASQEAKAQFPLRESRVEVFEVPGKPGAYKAVTYLRPHFQLDELTASLRLVTELPPSIRS